MNGKKSVNNDKLEENESKYIEFLKKEIKNAGNSIQFQHLLGNLGQLDFDVRCSFGTNKADVMKFLKKRSSIFNINEKGNVSLLKSVQKRNYEGKGSRSSSVDSRSSLPNNITGGIGIVTKVLPNFGFISSKEPFKTSVYFTAKDFQKENKNLLSDFEVFVGQKLCFNAVRGHYDYNAKYQATKVWHPSNAENDIPKVQNHKPRKNRETGLYDPERKTDFGVIQKVFPNFGFIIADGDEKNTVYFDKAHLQNYANIVDLRKILKVGDEVEYSAMRSTKKNAKARWEAMQVWVKKSHENFQSNGVQDANISRDINDCRSGSFKSNVKKSVTHQMLKDQSGKIYPRSHGVVLKFGSKPEELVDADSSLFYLNGSQVTDISWEFSEGDKVHFDAVKIKSAPGWKAVLVWVGDKPDIVLPTCIGDFSEFNDEENDEMETCSYTSKTSGASMLSDKSCSSRKSTQYLSVKSSDYNKASKSLLRHSTSDLRLGLNSCTNGKKFLSSESHNSLSDFGELDSASPTNANELSRSTSKASVNTSEGSERLSKHSELSFKNKRSYKRSKRKNVYKKQMSNYAYECGGNWGDSPYPDEETGDVTELSGNGGISSVNVHEDFNDKGKYEANDEVKTLNLNVNSFCEKYESLLSHTNSRSAIDVSHSTDLKDRDRNQVENEIQAVIDGEQKPKIKPYIKTFEGIDGKIQKVYCRYAEIENDCLQSSAAVFWNDFYRNGVSVEAHFDDLKEVLKPGDLVKFNCFEIVDDLGDCAHKVTTAWIGQKPDVTQITPEEYIKSENLSVTITTESNVDEIVETSSESMRLLNEKSKPLPPQKFLSVAYSNLENDEDEVDQVYSSNNNLTAENFFQDPSFSEQLQPINSSDCLGEPMSNSPILSLDEEQLPEMISKLLQSKGLICPDSEVDLNAVSSDVINFILSCKMAKDFPPVSKINIADKSIQTDAVGHSIHLCCSEELSKNLSDSSNIQFKETQTIITGEVIAATVFTQ